MGNRKADKHIDEAGRKLVGANLLREMQDAQILRDTSDKFRELERLAKKLSPTGEGPSRSTIQRITAGQVGASIDNLLLLARAMEVPPYRLFLTTAERDNVYNVKELMSRTTMAAGEKQEKEPGRSESRDSDSARPSLQRSRRP
jgi:hypothetical protein